MTTAFRPMLSLPLQEERCKGEIRHRHRKEDGRCSLEQKLGSFQYSFERNIATDLRLVRRKAQYFRYSRSKYLCGSESYNVIMRKIWEAADSHARQWRTVFKVRIQLSYSSAWIYKKHDRLGADITGSFTKERNRTRR